MSTIDMKQVAGLQAVNAEGKVIGTLSVDDLTELVSAKIIQEAKNEAVSARSASVMSEASTLAATDEYEDKLDIDTNPAYIRSMDSEGNPKRTATTSLATVVGGLISTATDNSKGLMSSIAFTYSSRQVDNNSNGGVINTLNFSMNNDSCVMLRLVCGRGDGQNAIIFLSICRNSSGVYSAKRMSFVHDKSGNFKSFGFIYYKDDTVYVRWGHYDAGSFQILALLNTTFKGVLNSPSESGFTKLEVSDMAVNPSAE